MRIDGDQEAAKSGERGRIIAVGDQSPKIGWKFAAIRLLRWTKIAGPSAVGADFVDTAHHGKPRVFAEFRPLFPPDRTS